MFISEPMLNCAWDALPKPSDCHPPEWGKFFLPSWWFLGEGARGNQGFFFDRKVEADIWGDFEANLLASVQWLPLFKQEQLMVKLIGMMECSSASDQRCGLLVNWMKWVMMRRSLQMFSSAWKPGSRLSQWTRYRRVVHCLLEISRVKSFEGKAITQNLEITFEWFEHQRFEQIANLQLSFCLS